MRRTPLAAPMLLAAAVALAAPAAAQGPDFEKAQIKTEKVAEGIWVLAGAGGNIGVSAGADGVFLIDLGNRTARRLILTWLASFMAITEQSLRAMPEWPLGDIDTDQPLLHGILQRTKRFQKILGHADRRILNDSTASFVRQILRVHPGTWNERLEHIRRETSSILSRETVVKPESPSRR